MLSVTREQDEVVWRADDIVRRAKLGRRVDDVSISCGEMREDEMESDGRDNA